MLEENALISGASRSCSAASASEGIKAFVKAGAELWARYRLHDGAGRPRGPASCRASCAQVADEGGFKIDVAVYPDVLVDRDFIKKNQSASYKNRFRVAGAKLTIDGSPQGFTAWRDRPYYKPVGNYPPGYVGYPSGDATSRRRRRSTGPSPTTSRSSPMPMARRRSDLLIAAIEGAQRKIRPGRPPAGADPRPVPARGPGRCLQGARRVPLALPDAHVLLGRLAPRPHGRSGARRQHLADRLGRASAACIFSSHHDAPVAFPDSMRVLDATVTRRSRSGDIIGPDQRVRCHHRR